MKNNNGKMLAIQQLETLKSQLLKQIESFKEKRRQYQRSATIAKGVTILCGFGITVLLGLDVESSTKLFFTNIALILGAIVTMLASWDAFANYRAFWYRFTFTYAQLLALKSEIEFEFPEGSKEITEVNIKRLYKKYQNILNENNEYWFDKRKEESSRPLA